MIYDLQRKPIDLTQLENILLNVYVCVYLSMDIYIYAYVFVCVCIFYVRVCVSVLVCTLKTLHKAEYDG